jgi:hypothetical protein
VVSPHIRASTYGVGVSALVVVHPFAWIGLTGE